MCSCYQQQKRPPVPGRPDYETELAAYLKFVEGVGRQLMPRHHPNRSAIRPNEKQTMALPNSLERQTTWLAFVGLVDHYLQDLETASGLNGRKCFPVCPPSIYLQRLNTNVKMLKSTADIALTRHGPDLPPQHAGPDFSVNGHWRKICIEHFAKFGNCPFVFLQIFNSTLFCLAHF